MTTSSDTLLDVTGMHCGACVRRITDALRSLDGVNAVEVRLRAGTVRVRHDPARTGVAHLIAALDRAGYGSRPGVAA